MPKKVLLFLTVLLIPTFSVLLKPGYFPMHDDMQAMRLLQMDKCVKDAQIPCRWVPDMGYGYGYPQFNFYAPLPYYAMEGFHLVGLEYLDSVKAGFILSIFISLIGMYLLGDLLWGKYGGFISSLLYIYAPYRAVNMYVRGAVGEFWALGFFPLIFWSSKKLIDGDKKSILWLALSLAGLFTSHNISTVLFIPIFFLWILYWLFQKGLSPISKHKDTLKRIFLSFVWGFSISSFFLIPAWIEKKYVHIETLIQGYFNYLAHFVSIKQLLVSSYWGYGSSELGPFDDMSFYIGIIHWLLPLLSILLLLLLKKKKELKLLVFITLMGWIALFMTHLKSVWIWNNLSFLSYLQFPWRFLVIGVFMFSLAAGSISLVLPKESLKRNILLFFFVVFVILLNSTFFQPNKWIWITDEEKFSGELWDKQQTISIFDYLPIYAELPPAERALDSLKTLSGTSEILSTYKGTDWQQWRVDIKSEEALLQAPIIYFPGWKVFSGDQEIPIKYNNDLGLITFNLEKGERFITAKLTDTPVRKAGNILSFLGLLAIPVYLRKDRKK